MEPWPWRSNLQDGVQGIAARQGQADFGAERGQACLLEGGLGGGALALEGVADAAFERIGRSWALTR